VYFLKKYIFKTEMNETYKQTHKQTQKQILYKISTNGIIDNLLFQNWNERNLHTHQQINPILTKWVQNGLIIFYFKILLFFFPFKNLFKLTLTRLTRKVNTKKTFEIENWKRKMFFSGFNKQRKKTKKKNKEKKQSW
jgi:hypothetical protein